MRVAAKTVYTSLRIILVYECNANVVYFDGVQLFTASGQRISKTVNGTTYNYHYLGDQLVEMAWGSNRMYFTYDDIGPASVIFNGEEYFYSRNAQGDVTGIFSEFGVQVATYTYDPWGRPTSDAMTTLGHYNPLRYRGYVYDNETGLYYLNSRYYNPTWGRFINADEYLSAGENLLSTNVFAYCYCDPINLKDPNGSMAEAALIFTDLSAELIASIAAALGVTVIWVVGIILIVGVVELSRSSTSSRSKSKTEILPDIDAVHPKRSKVYQIAHVDKYGTLVKFGHYNLMEALALLGCLGCANNLRHAIKYNPKGAESIVEGYARANGSKIWGIYTEQQGHAKMLALLVSANQIEPPEVHGSRKYGHYHDFTHSFHIWYGNIIYR